MDALNCLSPTSEPKATDYIPQMVDMIGRIVKSGHAYEAAGSVWFAVESVPGYGRLSGRSLVSLPPLIYLSYCDIDITWTDLTHRQQDLKSMLWLGHCCRKTTEQASGLL